MNTQHLVKLPNADRAVGQIVNVAVCERIFDRDGHPLSDRIIDTVDCRIVEIGEYWSNQPRGESGRSYMVEPLTALPNATVADRKIVLGI